MRVSKTNVADRYPAEYLEALGYHEAGHAVMAAMLGVPIVRVTIGPKCDYPDSNGKVFIEPNGQVPRFVVALMCVASERAERINPSFEKVASLHKLHRHLHRFSIGVKNDLTNGFNAVCLSYAMRHYTEGTALRAFKAEYRDLASSLIELKQLAVRRLAKRLIDDLEVDGQEIVSLVKRAGPGRRTPEGRRLSAALAALAWDRANLSEAKRQITRP